MRAAYMFQYNDINFYHHGDKSHNSTYRYHLGELSFSDVWYKNIRFAVGLRYELYDYDKFLYQEGNQGFDVGTEHFFSYFAQMHYETFDKAYFPTKGTSACLHSAHNFPLASDNAHFPSVGGISCFLSVTHSLLIPHCLSRQMVVAVAGNVLAHPPPSH